MRIFDPTLSRLISVFNFDSLVKMRFINTIKYLPMGNFSAKVAHNGSPSGNRVQKETVVGAGLIHFMADH